MKSSEDLKRCVRRICELLECEYGQKKHPAKTNPIDTLVLTILSQTTNFKNCKFHLNLIEHGRRICTAKKTKCNDCVLKDYCYC